MLNTCLGEVIVEGEGEKGRNMGLKIFPSCVTKSIGWEDSDLELGILPTEMLYTTLNSYLTGFDI